MQQNDENQLNSENTEANSDAEEASCVEEQALQDAQTEEPIVEYNADPPVEQPYPTYAVPQEQAPERQNKAGRLLDIALWLIVILLAVVVVLRLFVFGRITISGESMTASYYDDKSYASYNPQLTFHSGDVVRVNKRSKVSRGDVAVFYKYHIDSKLKAAFASGKDVQSGGKYEKLIKRVVALGGDKLWLEPCGDKFRLVIQTPEGDVLAEDYYEKNGTKLDADAFLLSTDLGRLTGTTADNPYVVREGCFFALGDNRTNSSDSRGSLGEFPLDQIYGVVI